VKPSRLKNIYPILLITLVMAISVLLLVTSEGITRALIESRQDQETLELLQVIFPETSFYTYDEGTEIYILYNNSRNEVGYAFYGKGWGFSYGLVVLIGLEDKETIRGIIVTSHHETRSYWYQLEKNNFFEQFNGLKIEDCILKHPSGTGGEVDGVTGATSSSRGVTNIVRETSLEKIEYLN
jgi:Na+-translocating ferredoxin:NAD+ oxidoreductase RnfG subunit